jgi:hypothetical protein
MLLSKVMQPREKAGGAIVPNGVAKAAKAVAANDGTTAKRKSLPFRLP